MGLEGSHGCSLGHDKSLFLSVLEGLHVEVDWIFSAEILCNLEADAAVLVHVFRERLLVESVLRDLSNAFETR